MENFTGVLDDPRSEEDKAKDFTHEEIFGTASTPYQWKEFNEADIPQYTIRNQNGSGECGAFSVCKALGVNNIKELGFKNLRPEFIYNKRADKTKEGMWMQDMFQIACKYGAPEDPELKGDNLTEEQANAYVPTEEEIKQALLYRGKNYVFMSPLNVDAIAKAIDDGYTPILLLRCDISEWTKEPFVNPSLTSPFNINHYNPCIYAGMRNGVKTIVTDDSWGSSYGANGHRYISEHFINTRVEKVGYIVDLENFLPPQFTSQLKQGSKGPEVLLLQKTLQKMGYFPLSQKPTAYFGVITKQAVIDFQKANHIDPVGEVGPITRELLNRPTPSQTPQTAQGEVLPNNTTTMSPTLKQELYSLVHTLISVGLTSFFVVLGTNGTPTDKASLILFGSTLLRVMIKATSEKYLQNEPKTLQ